RTFIGGSVAPPFDALRPGFALRYLAGRGAGCTNTCWPDLRPATISVSSAFVEPVWTGTESVLPSEPRTRTTVRPLSFWIAPVGTARPLSLVYLKMQLLVMPGR